MPTELIFAYVVFIVVPAGLALSIFFRRRSVEEKLARYEDEA
jgi:hypothetical protein